MTITISKTLTPEEFIDEYGLPNLLALIPPAQLLAKLPDAYRQGVMQRVVNRIKLDVNAAGYVLRLGSQAWEMKAYPVADLWPLQQYASVPPEKKAEALAAIDAGLVGLQSSLSAMQALRDQIDAL